MSLPINQVIIGDSGEVMAEWPGNSVDCFVTDPPYRIGFMGKEWDRALPPRRVFRQIFRVLKPGALAFIMSSPRQDVLWRMLSMLDGVGFVMRQSFISWIYKTGFPKAYDVSKGIDRKLGLERTEFEIDEDFLRRNPITNHKDDYSGELKDGYEASKRFISVSDNAKQWEGWKSQTGLKPAHECILMVNKPLSESTIVDNVLKWGTGAINVDACRIPYKSKEDKESAIPGGRITTNPGSFVRRDYNKKIVELDRDKWKESMKGRFPANLLISDEALDTGETTKSSSITRERTTPHAGGHGKTMGTGWNGTIIEVGYGDEGSPYRFFDMDAWAEHHGFLDVAKPSKAERDFGLSQFSEENRKWRTKKYKGFVASPTRLNGSIREDVKYRNKHPTVKPVKLMAYLIELGCPPKGIVVDPFLGSGTTCIAAKKLRRQWIGIEINPEYAEIARARIDIKGPLDQYMATEE